VGCNVRPPIRRTVSTYLGLYMSSERDLSNVLYKYPSAGQDL
jgi:hypothetical protein